MKFTAIITGTAALFSGLATASPVEAQNNGLAARATSADITGFSVTCGATSCSYLATATIQPENIVINFNATTTGSTIPSGVFYTSSDPLAALRINRPLGNYRLIITYGVAPPAEFDYFFPAGSFPGNAGYTGASSFTAS
ncbi:hypothetical protein QBC38DRAFT_371751 [Podospora fimiseda]|uniref:Uncharacterized protein n=1 Tax=Podospora fimiseda TaxID=252190 RepID=A0AAN7GWN3_9PEZI|nr:hypothetical protein QBC38DRAFT_371751 [Podospora fimiseda]